MATHEHVHLFHFLSSSSGLSSEESIISATDWIGFNEDDPSPSSMMVVGARATGLRRMLLRMARRVAKSGSSCTSVNILHKKTNIANIYSTTCQFCHLINAICSLILCWFSFLFDPFSKFLVLLVFFFGGGAFLLDKCKLVWALNSLLST